MYLGFFFGIPYLTWKLSQAESLDEESISNNNWKNGKSEHYVARAEYDFQTDRSGEISFKTGDTLRIAPKGTHASLYVHPWTEVVYQILESKKALFTFLILLD